MYNQNYKVELPQFPDREVSIAEYGAKSGDLQIETGRHNAEAINRAICEVSEQGGGMVRVPAGIWAVAPIRLFSGVNLHLDSQAMLKFIKSKEDYPLRITSYEGQDCIRTVSPVTAENAENIAVTKQLVEYARSVEKERGKNFRFTLTTNGMLIDDDVIDFANREMSNVVLSLDGRKEIHDRLRVDYAGNGSYERIVPKFQKLVEARGNKNYYMRGTFTHANPDFTKDLFHMADLGFTELSMEPVVCAPEDPAALTAEDLEIVKDQYELLAKDMLRREKEGKPITFYHYMLDLTGGPCIYKRISGCGSGTEYMAVTPWGDLYPCHQFVGEEAYKLGDIWNGVTNTALREEFRSCNAYARPECNDCWARFYCSGGCAANAFHATGSIRGVYEAGCELFRKRIECAIMMKVAEDSAKANG